MTMMNSLFFMKVSFMFYVNEQICMIESKSSTVFMPHIIHFPNTDLQKTSSCGLCLRVTHKNM